VCALLAAGAAGAAPTREPPRCFGAASRDTRRPCDNPELRRAVVPTPNEARSARNAPCTFIASLDEIHPCEFGEPAATAKRTIALVGDSHASHWRAALAVAAEARKWRGVSVTQTSCPLSRAVRELRARARSEACVRWKREIFPWFRAHPEISIVFVSGLAGGGGVVPRAGQSRFDTAVAGYAAAWRALPPSVHRIVVLRDTPLAGRGTSRCVEQAIARRTPAGPACALPRALVLTRDPAVAAAARMRSRRVRVVDLTRYFCGRTSCYPVIGGALVFKDLTHITAVFGETLGPFLLRKLGG
jgi:hypothetical protein